MSHLSPSGHRSSVSPLTPAHLLSTCLRCSLVTPVLPWALPVAPALPPPAPASFTSDSSDLIFSGVWRLSLSFLNMAMSSAWGQGLRSPGPWKRGREGAPGAWGRGPGGGRTLAFAERVLASEGYLALLPTSETYLDRTRWGLSGANFRGQLRFPPRPLLLSLLLTLFCLALSALSPRPSRVLCPLLWATPNVTPTLSP